MRELWVSELGEIEKVLSEHIWFGVGSEIFKWIGMFERGAIECEFQILFAIVLPKIAYF
jgi:hypothetical protein